MIFALVTYTLIANCFKTAGLLDETYDSGNVSVAALMCDVDLNNENIEGDVRRFIFTLLPVSRRIIIADLMNPAEENDCEEILEEGDYVDNIVQNIQERDGNREESPSHNMSNDCFLTLPSIKKQLKAIDIVKHVIAEYGELDDPLFLAAFRRLQRILRVKHSDSMKQCRIDTFVWQKTAYIYDGWRAEGAAPVT